MGHATTVFCSSDVIYTYLYNAYLCYLHLSFPSIIGSKRRYCELRKFLRNLHYWSFTFILSQPSWKTWFSFKHFQLWLHNHDMNQQVCYSIELLLRPPQLGSLALMSFLSEEMGKDISEIFWNFGDFKTRKFSLELYFQRHSVDISDDYFSTLDGPLNSTLISTWRLWSTHYVQRKSIIQSKGA